MNIKAISSVFVVGLAFIIAGCGGGGGGGTTGGGGGGGIVTTQTTVSGIASKGLLSGSTVNIFSVDGSGNKSTLLTTATTNANGSYSATISNYSGSVLVEVSGGTYTDEASGAINTPLSTTLRAAFNVPSGSTTISSAVTPLTEIAVQKMASFTPANVASANTLVSNLLAGGTDIISTLPVDVSNPGTATTAQKNYTLYLAAVSQLAQTNGSLSSALVALNSSINTTTQTLTDSTILTTPLKQFVATSTNNKITFTKAIIKLSTANVPTGKLIAGVDASVQLPTGITPFGLNGNDASKAIAVSGVAVGIANTLNLASFSSTTNILKIGQVTATGGMPQGEFLTITCDVASGASLNFPAQATIGSIIDSSGATITGVTVPVSVSFQ